MAYSNLGNYSPATQFQGTINTHANIASNGGSGSNLPVFNSKTANKTKGMEAAEVDFPSFETNQVEATTVTNSNNQPSEKVENNSAANPNPNGTATTVSTDSHPALAHQSTGATYTTKSSNIDHSANLKNTAYVAVSTKSNNFHHNTIHQPFLADNTSIISTETFDNGSGGNSNPSFIEEGSTPGDPGVIPVGDGVWILLALMAFYTTLKFKHRV